VKAFLVTFDSNFVEPNAAHTILTTLGIGSKWWHYLNSTYIIAVDQKTLSEMKQLITSRWPNSDGRFLIAEVKNTNLAGMLPKEAWDWINNNVS
jgi:hypothetical protein